MANNDRNNFDLTKELTTAERATVARNLTHIERMKRSMSPVSTSNDSAAEERRIAQEREASERRKNQEREESERRMLRDREEAERRISEEHERRVMLELEREEQLSQLRSREKEEDRERQREFDQDQRRRSMAVLYTEYDRRCELYYYLDERGDYIDAADARRRWQQLHAPSYLEYDPADRFWEVFTDDNGSLISRSQAFELWQLKNCPDYLSYSDNAVWTKYRCGDSFISAEEACKRWLAEREGSDEVKAHNVAQKVSQIAETAARGTAPLPDIGSDTDVICSLSVDSGSEKAEESLRSIVALLALATLILLGLFIASIAIYDLNGKGVNQPKSFWAKRDTWVMFLKWTAVSGVLFFITYPIANFISKKNSNHILERVDKDQKMMDAHKKYQEILDLVATGISQVNGSMNKSHQNAEAYAFCYNLKKDLLQRLNTPNLPYAYVKNIKFKYYEVSIFFGSDTLSQPYNAALAKLLYIFDHRATPPIPSENLQRYISRGGRYNITLGFLKQSAAERIVNLFGDLGIGAKADQKYIELFKKEPAEK